MGKTERLGDRVKKARIHRDMEQSDLVAASKVSQQHVSNIERRPAKVTEFLFELADALEVNPKWLLKGDPEPSWLESPADGLQAQLNEIYSQLDQDRRDSLLGRANALLAEQKPGGKHDPYGKPSKRPQKAPTGKKAPTA